MKLLAIVLLLMSSAPGFGQEAEFLFKKPVHKFPKTAEGKVLTHYFVFTNTGKAPLVISSYTVECSCTEVTFPKYPIPPGKTDSIKVIFNTAGKYYLQDRKVILSSNARKEGVVSFKVFVKPAED